jgi:hypothetical protein
MIRRSRPPGLHRWSLLLAIVVAHLCIGWSGPTVHHVAWTAVDFFPADLAGQIRRHDDRFNAGIRRGLAAPPAWRAGPPGSLPRALDAQVQSCANDLRKPVPFADLVEEIGVLAVLVLDVNDPLAAIHDDPREASYAAAYQSYVNSILEKLRLVYYGQNHDLIYGGAVTATIDSAFARSGSLYPFIGEEFYRTGELRDWRVFDDRSVTFGVAGVSMSRALTDLANIVTYVWRQGGGRVPTPRPTPIGHVGPTITRSLEGGFPKREAPGRGEPAMPRSSIQLPPP